MADPQLAAPFREAVRRHLDLTVRAWAGVLHAGDGAMLTGRAALVLAGVLDEVPAMVEIAVPHARVVRDQPGYRFTRHRPGVHATPPPRHLPAVRMEDALRDVERAHRLAPSVRQHVVPETGHRSDGAYLRQRLLLEHDGQAFHGGSRRLRDVQLDAEHAAHGYLTIRTTHAMVVASPCRTARMVDAARVARGGVPTFRPCPRCRLAPPGGDADQRVA